MERFTRLEELEEEEEVEEDRSRPECSICYDAYDHVFKQPKVLECTHTFCLECLSHFANGRLGDGLPCPLCRRGTALPSGGPPALTTDQEILRQLPGPQRQEEPVWLEGEELCCKSYDSAGAPEEQLCICVDIGAARTPRAGLAPRRRRPSTSYRHWFDKIFSPIVAVLLVVAIIIHLKHCVKLLPTTTPASHEARRPRDPPATTPAGHEARPSRGPPTTRAAHHAVGHKARPPQGPPTTRPAHHEARPPRGRPTTRPTPHMDLEDYIFHRFNGVRAGGRHHTFAGLCETPAHHNTRKPRGRPTTRPA
ncbi:RING finger protein 223 [Liparis tanakae]|uniref:RING finger protein 223 n=1 Tax=Liparis tanakae TaxID=230148 RepID=A0A4Z2EIR6_9TELE|nr:RING finger protein 223 [Liparis tanakae]